MRRVSAAGFKPAVARALLLPDWWDDTCADDPALVPEIEFRVARFLGVSLAAVRDPRLSLAAPAYRGAQLRRVRNITLDRVAPAIHVGLRVAEATVRCWRGGAPMVDMPPIDPETWRQNIPRTKGVVRLDGMLSDLWTRGIPVVHIETMPSPSFQGMVCLIEGRPVLILAHDFDEPARLAFIIAHEAAHAVFGDCAADHPVVDEDDSVEDEGNTERRADHYSIRVLAGPQRLPTLKSATPKNLARQASALERNTGVDASLIIRRWGKEHQKYDVATLAVKALYKATGGKRLIREAFDQHIDLEGASETDRALLRCIHGDPRRYATSD